MGYLILVMILVPLAGAILNGLILKTPYPRRAGVIGTLASTTSFVIAVVLYVNLMRTGQPMALRFPWMLAGDFRVDWGFQFDWLTAVMALFVTGIGSLIHLYSIGYMAEERTPSRYFAYLNLFLASMILLITGASLPVLFVGWEGVGVCSYLLIGYWYEDPAKTMAGMKAFIVNRIGDAGFLLGIFLCWQLFHTLNFGEMAGMIGKPNGLSLDELPKLNLAALLLFIGAMGKSAQIPLYIWLPDAMAGPTPVSALIHAATMVTAGVYMIARMNFLYQVTSETSAFIAAIGVATALLAALIATCQRDIKKVLAYSTVSQLGYMFMALGTGAYLAAIFHVVTHAFFKALLFLGAGSVIHGLHGEQDIWKMGGLRKVMPYTYWTFLIATLAISGIPPFAGFFSKDLILFSVLSGGSRGWFLWGLGSFASILTAFYMMRLFTLVFLGEYRGPHDVHPHESPAVMWIPLVVLAVGSATAGFLEIPERFGFGAGILGQFLSRVLPTGEATAPPLDEFSAMGLAVLGAVLSMSLAYWLYIYPKRVERASPAFRPFQVIFKHKFFVDEFYHIAFVRPFELVSRWLSSFVDPQIIDGLAIFPSRVCRAGATVLSFLQWGSAQFYMLIMLVGGLIILWMKLKGMVFT